MIYSPSQCFSCMSCVSIYALVGLLLYFKGGSRHKAHHYSEKVIFFIRHFNNYSTLHRNALATLRTLYKRKRRRGVFVQKKKKSFAALCQWIMFVKPTISALRFTQIPVRRQRTVSCVPLQLCAPPPFPFQLFLSL